MDLLVWSQWQGIEFSAHGVLAGSLPPHMHVQIRFHFPSHFLFLCNTTHQRHCRRLGKIENLTHDCEVAVFYCKITRYRLI